MIRDLLCQMNAVPPPLAYKEAYNCLSNSASTNNSTNVRNAAVSTANPNSLLQHECRLPSHLMPTAHLEVKLDLPKAYVKLIATRKPA